MVQHGPTAKADFSKTANRYLIAATPVVYVVALYFLSVHIAQGRCRSIEISVIGRNQAGILIFTVISLYVLSRLLSDVLYLLIRYVFKKKSYKLLAWEYAIEGQIHSAEASWRQKLYFGYPFALSVLGYVHYAAIQELIALVCL